jgi:hypothetical protein
MIGAIIILVIIFAVAISIGKGVEQGVKRFLDDE